ncbi:MAG: ATP-binding protein, partial [Thermodesulfobacteriota bacterium]
MTKIKSINIRGIRGFKDLLPLTLNQKSTLIYGDNGSGKSSLTDALEWFYSDEIGHLSNEEIGRKGRGAVRNIFIPDDEDAYVEIVYSDSTLDARKSIDNSLQTDISNSSDGFKKFIKSTQSENLILRYRDLVQFIIATKKDKLDTLQRIIGFQEVGNIRELLKKSYSRIARNIKTSNFDNKKSVQQSAVLDNLGQNVTSLKQFFDVANEFIKPLKLKIKINSLKDIQKVLKEIKSKEDTALLDQIAFHTKISENLTEIAGNVDNIQNGYKAYYTTYSELRKDPNKIKKLQLLSLFLEGKRVLENDVIQEGYCPLCQQEKSKLELINELNERIEELEELQTEKGKLDRQAQGLKQIVQVNLNTIDSLLKEKLFKEAENSELLGKVQQIRTTTIVFQEEPKKDLFAIDHIKELYTIPIDKDKIKDLAERSKGIAKTLTDSKKEN